MGGHRIVTDPPLARFLFGDTRLAPVWLLVRLYVGWAWLDAGLHKAQDPASTLIGYAGIALGIALIAGGFTGVVAAAGALLNLSSLAATASANPVLLLLGFLLILAWKTAGYVGLDRFLLPALGTPWHDGRMRVRAVDDA